MESSAKILSDKWNSWSRYQNYNRKKRWLRVFYLLRLIAPYCKFFLHTIDILSEGGIKSSLNPHALINPHFFVAAIKSWLEFTSALIEEESVWKSSFLIYYLKIWTIINKEVSIRAGINIPTDSSIRQTNIAKWFVNLDLYLSWIQ